MYDERTSKLSIEEYYHSIVQQSGFGLQYIKNQTYEKSKKCEVHRHSLYCH